MRINVCCIDSYKCLLNFLVAYFCCLRTKMIVSFSLLIKKYWEFFISLSLHLFIWRSTNLISEERDFQVLLGHLRAQIPLTFYCWGTGTEMKRDSF